MREAAGSTGSGQGPGSQVLGQPGTEAGRQSFLSSWGVTDFWGSRMGFSGVPNQRLLAPGSEECLVAPRQA